MEGEASADQGRGDPVRWHSHRRQHPVGTTRCWLRHCQAATEQALPSIYSPQSPSPLNDPDYHPHSWGWGTRGFDALRYTYDTLRVRLAGTSYCVENIMRATSQATTELHRDGQLLMRPNSIERTGFENC